jgi:hypothetical protein
MGPRTEPWDARSKGKRRGETRCCDCERTRSEIRGEPVERKIQLGGQGSAVSTPIGVWGKAPAANDFGAL